ncbi:hypothetical protein [uncultured Mediterranean phage]|nr:hypothetical protein [uncultured Mediterranean phage]
MDNISKQLSGGAFVVKKRGSNVKSRSKGGSSGGGCPVDGKKRGGYSNYLMRNKSSTASGSVKGGSKSTDTSGSKKVSLVNNRRRSNKKKKRKFEPAQIPIIIPKSAPVKPVKSEPVKSEPVKSEPVKSEPVKAKQKLKTGVQLKPIVPDKKPVSRRSNRTKRSSRIKQGKKVSVTRSSRLSNKDVDKIQEKLKSIKSKKPADIKKELDKQGISVSGKSPSILKDIYLYSQLCGINIKRE